MYDAGTRPNGFLRAYAREFSSVEIDATFYGTPPPGRLARWAAQVPAGFTFALKVPREITHDHRLRNAAAPLDAFVAVLAELDERLEAVLVQLPPDFTADESATLEAFVASLPRGVRWAVELRDGSWFRGDAHRRMRDALGSHGVAVAATDGGFVPLDAMLHEVRRPVAPHAYVRWLGARETFARFDRVQIDRGDRIARWAEAIRDAGASLARVAGYANNEFAGHAPQTVRDVYAALGAPHTRPALTQQRSLFEESR